MWFLLCLIIQPEGSLLFSKLDALYEKQLREIGDKASNPQKHNLNAKQAANAKQEYSLLKKNYTITIPMFNFSDGVREGDLGTIGLYRDERIGQRVPDGRGGTVFVPSGKLVSRMARIRGTSGQYTEVKLLPSIGGEDTVLVSGIPSELLIEDKVIPLSPYIFEYKGKNDKTRFRVYDIVGNSQDLESWRKLRAKK